MYSGKESFKNLKQEAKTSLRGRWALAIVVTFLNIVMLMLPDVLNREYKVARLMNLVRENQMFPNYHIYDLLNSIEMIKVPVLWRVFIGIVNLVFVGALSFGIARFFIKLVRRDNPQIKNLFEGFKILGKTILINVVLSIFKFLWYLLSVIIISLFALGGVLMLKKQHYIENKLFIVVVIFTIVSLAIILGVSIFLNRYALTYYIINDNRKLDVMDSINKSVEMMKGNNIRLFLLYLSFIGWYILGVVSLGIGFIWIIPYVKATVATFYNSLYNS